MGNLIRELGLLPLACVAMVCSLLIVAIRTVWRPKRKLPPQFYRPVTWTGPEVCLALLVVTVVVTPLTHQLLLNSAFLDWLYDLDAFLDWAPPAALGSAPVLLLHLELASLRLVSWAQALAFPCEVALILFFFRQISGTRPADLGLSSDRLAADTVLGASAWLVVTPGVWLVNILVNILYSNLIQQRPQEHPFTHLILGQPPLVDWILLLFLTVMAAPFLEELIFRGVLQQWLSRRPWGGGVALIAAFALALLSRTNRLFEALLQRDVGLVLSELAPVWFVLALFPGIFLMDRLAPRLFAPATPVAPEQDQVENDDTTPYAGTPFEDSGRATRNGIPVPLEADQDANIFAARAWYGVAVLFAAAHATVWPSPIPLFFLALGLGWLALRTQSLVPSMVFHGLFNGVTCLMLIL